MSRLSRAESRADEAETYARHSLEERTRLSEARSQELEKRLEDARREGDAVVAGIRQEQEEKERVMRQECEELNVRERRELDLRFLETSRQHDETRAAMRKYHDDLLKELIAAVKHSIGLSRQVGGVDASVQRREYRSRIREYGFDATSSPDRSQFDGEEKEDLDEDDGETTLAGDCDEDDKMLL